MIVDPRDQLWNAVYDTYYECYWREFVSDKVVNGWEIADLITKVLVAMTASGSAVAGWQLWNQPGFQELWAVLAGFAALVAIVHAALSIPRRLADWGEVKRIFASLRVDLETLRHRMEIDPEFSVEEFTQLYVEYRQRYKDGIQLIKNDILFTRRVRVKSMADVDRHLAANRNRKL